MQTISRKDVIYQFSPENKPITTVEPGETFLVQTDDCFASQLKDSKDLITDIDFSRVNPATGPIEVKGAQPGDLLAVDILDLQVGPKGFMVAIPEEGGFGDVIEEPATKMIPVRDGRFWFTPDLGFPIHPMIGVIGVAPAEGEVSCGEIGDHGGNMDAKIIRKGARIYFLVQKDGAMLAMGDAHAGMGDGESVVCGVEITAEVTVRVNLIKKPVFRPKRPVVELDDQFITIAHGPSLDEAASTVLHDMLELIHFKTGMPKTEIAMLISAVGDLKVCQIVDPQKTARVEMPKSILDNSEEPLFS